jgi:hypothetical protein
MRQQLDKLIAEAEARAREATYNSGSTFRVWELAVTEARMRWQILHDIRFDLGPHVMCETCKGTGFVADGWQGKPVPAGCCTCHGRGKVLAAADRAPLLVMTGGMEDVP